MERQREPNHDRRGNNHNQRMRNNHCGYYNNYVNVDQNYMHGNHPRMPAMRNQRRPVWRPAFGPPPPPPPPPYFIPSPYHGEPGFFQPGPPPPLPWYARPLPPPVVPPPSETPPLVPPPSETPSVVPPPPSVPRLPPLKDRVCRQIEYYFSEENLKIDNYLKSLMDQGGWVNIKEISKFNMVKTLTENLSLITEALQSSEILEVQDLKVRKRPI